MDMESILLSSIRDYLKVVLKNFDTKTFNLSFLNGKSTLKDLYVNEDVIKELIGFPNIDVTHCYIHELRICAPALTKLGQEPITFFIDHIELELREPVELVKPNTLYSQLLNIESPSKKTKAEPTGTYGWTERIVDNFRFEIFEIDVRLELVGQYKHKARGSWSPPVLSMTLADIEIFSTDERWQQVRLDIARKINHGRDEIYVFRQINVGSVDLSLVPAEKLAQREAWQDECNADQSESSDNIHEIERQRYSKLREYERQHEKQYLYCLRNTSMRVTLKRQRSPIKIKSFEAVLNIDTISMSLTPFEVGTALSFLNGLVFCLNRNDTFTSLNENQNTTPDKVLFTWNFHIDIVKWNFSLMIPETHVPFSIHGGGVLIDVFQYAKSLADVVHFQVIVPSLMIENGDGTVLVKAGHSHDHQEGPPPIGIPAFFHSSDRLLPVTLPSVPPPVHPVPSPPRLPPTFAFTQFFEMAMSQVIAQPLPEPPSLQSEVEIRLSQIHIDLSRLPEWIELLTFANEMLHHFLHTVDLDPAAHSRISWAQPYDDFCYKYWSLNIEMQGPNILLPLPPRQFLLSNTVKSEGDLPDYCLLHMGKICISSHPTIPTPSPPKEEIDTFFTHRSLNSKHKAMSFIVICPSLTVYLYQSPSQCLGLIETPPMMDQFFRVSCITFNISIFSRTLKNTDLNLVELWCVLQEVTFSISDTIIAYTRWFDSLFEELDANSVTSTLLSRNSKLEKPLIDQLYDYGITLSMLPHMFFLLEAQNIYISVSDEFSSRLGADFSFPFMGEGMNSSESEEKVSKDSTVVQVSSEASHVVIPPCHDSILKLNSHGLIRSNSNYDLSSIDEWEILSDHNVDTSTHCGTALHHSTITMEMRKCNEKPVMMTELGIDDFASIPSTFSSTFTRDLSKYLDDQSPATTVAVNMPDDRDRVLKSQYLEYDHLSNHMLYCNPTASFSGLHITLSTAGGLVRLKMFTETGGLHAVRVAARSSDPEHVEILMTPDSKQPCFGFYAQCDLRKDIHASGDSLVVLDFNRLKFNSHVCALKMNGYITDLLRRPLVLGSSKTQMLFAYRKWNFESFFGDENDSHESFQLEDEPTKAPTKDDIQEQLQVAEERVERLKMLLLDMQHLERERESDH